MDGLHDGHGVEEARLGFTATGSFCRVEGPLDWGSRGLGDIGSHRCSCNLNKTCLGVSRSS